MLAWTCGALDREGAGVPMSHVKFKNCQCLLSLRGDVKISHSRMTKHAGEHWQHVCEMYATSHKRPFVPSVGGIRLLYVMYRQRAQSVLSNIGKGHKTG